MPRTRQARGRALLLTALVLLPSVVSPQVGTYAFGVSALLLLVLMVGRAAGSLDHVFVAVASGLALLGGAVAVYSAASAIVDVGGIQPYDTRVAFGWAALAFGALAATTGAITFRRPVAAAAVMVLTGMLGCVAISVFFINTWYIGAMPLWLCAAVLRVKSAGSDA